MRKSYFLSIVITITGIIKERYVGNYLSQHTYNAKYNILVRQ